MLRMNMIRLYICFGTGEVLREYKEEGLGGTVMKKRINRVICRLFGRHWFVIGTDIRDGRVTLECPYCGETLFDYEERPNGDK